jgi:uncharacterized protein YukE
MADGGYEVDPERLEAVARGVHDVGETVHAACRSREGRFGPGATGGWQTAAAGRTAADAWANFTVELATSLTDLSDDMRTSARGYRDAEERAQQRFTGGHVPR